jgi:flagellar basal body P-ring formation protein FlgA
MMRFFVVLSMLMVVFSVLSATVKLKESHVVEKELLSLSDFFDGLAPDQDQEILEAPAIGMKKHYPHVWVTQLAKNFGIQWEPQHTRGIEFTRENKELKSLNILEFAQGYIASAYPEKCIDPFEIKLDPSSQYAVPTRVKNAPDVSSFVWLAGDNFLLTIGVDGQDKKIKGSFSKIVYVPTLNKLKYPGQLIEKEDVVFTTASEKDLPHQVLLVESDLVGKVVGRRVIKSNAPIKEADVAKPTVLKRGDIVTLKVETKNIVITTRGKAEKNAAVGDIVPVLNIASKKMVEGVVKDAQTVVIPTLR